MTKKRLFALVLSLIPQVLAADTLAINPHHPQHYTVKRGDTLWDISAKFLQHPWQWPKLWRLNPKIKNPHWIYPGDELTLVYRNGRPMLQVNGRDAGTLGGRDDYHNGRDAQLSPRLLTQEHERAIPPIPLDAIWPFLSQHRVVGPEDLSHAPYVVSSQDEHLVAGPGNRIYVRGLPQNTASQRFVIVRCGAVYRHPPEDGMRIQQRYTVSADVAQGFTATCTGKPGENALGYEALHVAEATLLEAGDPATLTVTRSHREILVGDRLLPETEAGYPEFIPDAPKQAVAGNIISVMDALSQVGSRQIVVLDRGELDGLEPGNVLAVHQAGVMVDDRVSGYQSGTMTGLGHQQVELPRERIGELMVFQIYPRVSYALVMRSNRPVHLYDMVREP